MCTTTETFGTNSNDFSVWELMGYGQEQHTHVTEAFGANSDVVNDVDSAGRKLGWNCTSAERKRLVPTMEMLLSGNS